MPVLTAPIKILINCSKHGEAYASYEFPECRSCNLLRDYHKDYNKLMVGLQILNDSIALELKQGNVVPVEQDGKWIKS
jgi:hypothetical protein